MKNTIILLSILVVSVLDYKDCVAQSVDKNYIDSVTRVFTDSIGKIQLKLVGQPFPDFKAKSIQHTYFSQASLLGKTTFVAYWFSSCSPCRAAYDSYKALAQRADSTDVFQFISFTNDTESLAQKNANSEGFNFPIITYFDNYKTYPAFNFGYPLYFIVDKLGIIRFTITGGYVEKEKSKIFFSEKILPKLAEILKEN